MPADVVVSQPDNAVIPQPDNTKPKQDETKAAATPPTSEPTQTPIHKIQGLPPIIPGVISIKPNHIQQVATQTVPVVPLTQDTVEAYWKEMIAALTEPLPQLPSLLQDIEVMLDPEKPNTIRLITSNVFFDNDFKPMAIRVMEFMRQKSGNPDLNYTVIVKTVKQDVLNPYAPREKYDTMLETNPNLALLRKLFTDIDY